MWTAEKVTSLRERLNVERPAFARVVGVDARTVARWESGTVHPSGPSEAVLNAIQEKLDTDPAHSDVVVKYLVAAAGIGGLAYLIKKLLDEMTDR